MFHKAINLSFKEGTVVVVTFQNGIVKEYDMSRLAKKYPQINALKNHSILVHWLERFCNTNRAVTL